ncbi:deaminase [Arthrobacter alpinus]|uniref:dihydrofolate reductase family protein n=1 Tax=Arthrobacter alpinus TaxID=656366 RepID=UPI0005C8AEB4|nr:dihydrofolate reductase family protein [Arthrobacter alpinus]ALV45107.1 deaminase [Arthrobacter alpinus]
MRKLVYFISLSLDGFIAGPEDQVDFFAGSDDYVQYMVTTYSDLMPHHARVQLGMSDQPLNRFDTVVMGRRTYGPALQMGITSPYSHLQQVVFSRTLASPDPQVNVTAEDPREVIRGLKNEDSRFDIYLAGGGQLAAALLPDIDELIIKRYPVIIGSGLRAFDHEFTPAQFSMLDTVTFDSGNSMTRFVPLAQ